MNLFYAPDITTGIYRLEGEEANHLSRVLRKNIGDVVRLTDGKGSFYDCMIVGLERKACDLEILKVEKVKERSTPLVHIAVAPTKNISRFEWFLEKATEIGVDRITPFVSRHSERKVIKWDRLEKVVVAAMKQSLKCELPRLDQLMTLDDVLKIQSDQKYIAYISPDVNIQLQEAFVQGKDALVLIGPEGDFDREEVERAEALGFTPVSLGQSRLRTETAAVVACHTLNLLGSIKPMR